MKRFQVLVYYAELRRTNNCLPKWSNGCFFKAHTIFIVYVDCGRKFYVRADRIYTSKLVNAEVLILLSSEQILTLTHHLLHDIWAARTILELLAYIKGEPR